MSDAPERIWADWSPADEDTMPATIGCYTPKTREVARWKRVDYVRADLVEALPAVQPGHVNKMPKSEHVSGVMLTPATGDA